MKERSVVFYKRLIVSSALIIVLAAALAIGLAVWEIFQRDAADMKPDDEEIKSTVGIEDDNTAAEEDIESISTKKENVKDVKDTEAETKKDGNIDRQSKPRVYLTFDDGASKNTEDILALLEEKDVKATFFFNMNEKFTSDAIVKKTYKYGHVIGAMTSTEEYGREFDSLEAYEHDLKSSIKRIEELTGEMPEVARVSGGTVNVYTKDIYKDILEIINENDLVAFDWNVCADDGKKNISTETMVRNGTLLPARKNVCVVLIHDNGKDNICQALSGIIDFYKERGYSFEVLSKDTEPVRFV